MTPDSTTGATNNVHNSSTGAEGVSGRGVSTQVLLAVAGTFLSTLALVQAKGVLSAYYCTRDTRRRRQKLYLSLTREPTEVDEEGLSIVEEEEIGGYVHVWIC